MRSSMKNIFNDSDLDLKLIYTGNGSEMKFSEECCCKSSVRPLTV